VAGSLFLGLPLPVTAAQILWVNLVEDSLPAFALAMDQGEGDVMKRAPYRRGTPILTYQTKAIIFLASLVVDALLIFTFSFIWHKTGDLLLARTVTFVGLVSHSLFVIYAIRNLRKNIWRTTFWKNNFLNLSVISGFVFLAAAVYVPFLQRVFKTVPLDYRVVGALLGIGLFSLFCVELVKLVFIRINKID
jgi:Ca2+-transporting ATPase